MASKNKIKALDTAFSQYIRLRDSNDQGIGYCCSCGKAVHWKDADAGHYINRKWHSTRWDEKNVHLQCRACNRFDEGNLPGYGRFMQRRYGDDTIDYLLSIKRQSMGFTDFDLDILLKDYRIKVKELLTKKG